jgi:hypothetical protein
MNFKSIMLAVVIVCSSFGFQPKSRALDNQQFYSRLGLAGGLLISGVGLYSLGYVGSPQMLLKKIGKVLPKTARWATSKLKLDKYSNNAKRAIFAGLVLSGVSLKFLK